MLSCLILRENIDFHNLNEKKKNNKDLHNSKVGSKFSFLSQCMLSPIHATQMPRPEDTCIVTSKYHSFQLNSFYRSVKMESLANYMI